MKVQIDDTTAFGCSHSNHSKHRVYIDGLTHQEAKELRDAIETVLGLQEFIPPKDNKTRAEVMSEIEGSIERYIAKELLDLKFQKHSTSELEGKQPTSTEDYKKYWYLNKVGYTGSDMLEFCRYVWYNKSLKDTSKGLIDYFQEWKDDIKKHRGQPFEVIRKDKKLDDIGLVGIANYLCARAKRSEAETAPQEFTAPSKRMFREDAMNLPMEGTQDGLKDWEDCNSKKVSESEFNQALKKCINDILLDMQNGKRDIGQAANDLLGLKTWSNPEKAIG